MWKELVQRYSENMPPRFEIPASDEELAEAEAALGVAFPDELKDCLGESNGIWGDYDQGLIWPLERIVSDNRQWVANSLRDYLEGWMTGRLHV